MYDNMSRQDLMKRMSFVTDSIQNAKNEATEAEQEQLNKIGEAMEELKKAYDNDTIMDEYVEPIEEVKEDGNDKSNVESAA